MKAISLWQPWASLWLSPAKVHETRHWSTNYRGMLAIHAAKRLVSNCGLEVDEICCAGFGAGWRLHLPRGAFIGVLDLTDCVSTNQCRPIDSLDYACGDWSGDRFAWRRGRFWSLREPIPFKGRQGFFKVDNAILGISEYEMPA